LSMLTKITIKKHLNKDLCWYITFKHGQITKYFSLFSIFYYKHILFEKNCYGLLSYDKLDQV